MGYSISDVSQHTNFDLHFIKWLLQPSIILKIEFLINYSSLFNSRKILLLWLLIMCVLIRLHFMFNRCFPLFTLSTLLVSERLRLLLFFGRLIIGMPLTVIIKKPMILIWLILIDCLLHIRFILFLKCHLVDFWWNHDLVLLALVRTQNSLN